MKHTPGPWTIADENNQCCSVLLGTQYNLTCSMDRQDGNTGKFVIEREEMLANAKLIASAPVMIDRLTLIENLATQVCDAINKRDAIAYEETLISIKMLAREAIVEATDKGYHSFNQRGNSV